MPRGFYGGFRGGYGRGFGMRRYGVPLFGGMGMGFGLGPLLSGLLTGGLGYLIGRESSNPQMLPQQQYPQYPPQQAPSAPASPTDESKLAQLKLLGELHDSGVLTDEEFVREKQRLLNR